MIRLSDLVAWRQPAADRAAQQAFLDDVHAHWMPRSPRERLLEWRSRLTHARMRLFGGSASLAPAALAALPLTIGLTMFAITPTPVDPMFDPGPPPWAYLLLTLGFIGFSAESALSPRAIRPGSFLLRAAVPLATGAVAIAAQLVIWDIRDDVLRPALLGMAIGMIATAATATNKTPRGRTVHGTVRRLTGVTLLVAIGANAAWAVSYVSHGLDGLAVAAVGSSIGGAMVGWAMVAARLEAPRVGVPVR